MTIRTRLTLVFAVLVASILLLFSVIIYLIFSKYRGDEFEQRLQYRAEDITEALSEVPGKDANYAQRLARQDNEGLYRFAIFLYSQDDTLLYARGASKTQLTKAQQALVRQGQSLYLREDESALLAVPFTDAQGVTGVLAISAEDRYGFTKLHRLREILLMGWVISLGLLIMAGYLFAGDVLKPIVDITRQVNDISATSINARLRVGREPDELNDLAATFNNMLGRLEEGFTAQKNFVTYASHELRTPLTAMIGHLEVTLMKERSTDEYRHLMEGLLEEARSMKQLVNGLLELAYASADASTLTFQPVRVDELLFQVQEGLQSTHPDYTISIEFESIPDDDRALTVQAVEPLLRTAIMNIIDNGCRYSTDHRLTAYVHAEGEIRLRFRDHGPGIPVEAVPHIFEPFYRPSDQVNTTQSGQGHGLGLALAQRIVKLHKGRINVHTGTIKGTEMVVFLPNY